MPENSSTDMLNAYDIHICNAILEDAVRERPLGVVLGTYMGLAWGLMCLRGVSIRYLPAYISHN